ncbi:DUF1217 domain-containing protein [Methylocapsa palsarum]|uniref:Flagellar basal-body rod protein FlgF n=1 Tax=Methylocapsa palsarum TaxID=1612308 RepID=A0A1I4CB36_9HYPH|nr:DUF1217 domain-containing protein [Methylocapsa palsarum]SFK78384.1 Protein of unknown function [Methylocapsa palsarum]
MLNATVYFNVVTKDYAKTLTGAASDPAVARESKYYLANIGKIQSVDAFMKNDRLYTFAMKAFGLSDMMNAKALIRKVLEGGVADSKSLANTLHDPRYKALATALNFASDGASATSPTAARQGVVNQYVEQSLEANVGKQNTGAQMALYFQRMAPGITSAYSILGDKTLLNVVETALGLPASMSQQNIDSQAKMINARLKISDLQSPVKLQRFLERLTATYDSQHSSGASLSPTSALDVTSPGISQDLLLSIANLKLGGP